MLKTQILVVEDEIIIAKDIQRSLENLGYDVTAAVASGEEALKKILVKKPDLVLMDIMLQGEIDGIETANEIRSEYDIPVIYLSAYADEKMLERAKISEPFGYMLKPFEDRELLTNIEMALYKHKLERRLRENEEWLSTTLNSIGDAVVATDVNLCINFMNPVARQFTGWQLNDARGKHLREVFNVVDAWKIDLLEDHSTLFATFHRTNKIELRGLELISLNGQAMLINGCIAPIKDYKGNITGVVLAFQNITERKLAEEALAMQREKFISVLIHDLKTPLIAIAGYGKRYLSAKVKEEKEKNGIVEIILGISQELLRTIEDTSSSLKKKATLQMLKPETLELAGIILSVVKSSLPQVECNGLTLYVNDRPKEYFTLEEPINVTGDSTQLKTMVENLLSNAIKYARSLIKINFFREGGTVRFVISDDGPGISDAYHARIFEEYFQVPGSVKGTGLGLYSVKKVVENHKGKITVKSSGNLGTTFEVVLPADDEANEVK
ncbi:MAG: response regulator [Nitrospirae bacterium]|nr:response regulator [Nitrospirota bacterium]